MKHFVGIEIRNIQMDDDEYVTRYVSKETIIWAYPDTDFTNDNDIFNKACECLEHYEKGVVSCDVAKPNEYHYA